MIRWYCNAMLSHRLAVTYDPICRALNLNQRILEMMSAQELDEYLPECLDSQRSIARSTDLSAADYALRELDNAQSPMSI